MKSLHRLFFALLLMAAAFTAHGEIDSTFKNFKIQQPQGFNNWESETLITSGPQKGQKVSQKNCVDQQQAAANAMGALAASEKMTACKTTVVQDTASYGESIQTCDMGIAQSKTVLKMKKLSDTAFQTEVESSINGAPQSTAITTTKIAGPCTPEQKPAQVSAGASAECKQCQENIKELKGSCAKDNTPPALCDSIVKQMEAACRMGCR